MNNNRFLQSLICLLAVSCSVNELDMQVPDRSEDLVFHATLESSEPDTKVYLDNYLKILWNHDDRISIFNKSTLNQQFYFAGETGENSGDFFWVENDYFGAGNSLGYICAIYPYSESTSISNSNVLTLTLPEVQTYNHDNPKSFGQGANTMVSVTNDRLLRFKNVGGYLAFRFYGGSSENPISVSSIRLVGNNGETLSGEATMTPVIGQLPEIRWTSTTGKSILLDCGETGVNLGTTREDATIFWMVVPPTSFSGGFTLLVTDTNGDVFIKKTTKELTVDRNAVLRVSPIQVDMDSAGLSLNNVSSADPEKLPSTTAIDNRTFTVTMPTLDRSHLVLNYDFTGESLMANGQAFEPGDPIDVTKPVTLTVYSGNYGKNYTIVGKNTGLPIVRITTSVLTNGSTGFSVGELDAYQNRLQNKDKYSRDTTKWVDERVWLPETEDVFITVRIEDFDGSPGMKSTAGVPLYETDSQIKGRGNYSWKWEKKPYALKFDSKREVLGMPAHKRWVLLANWRDRTLLRNDATFWLAKKAHDELPYTTRGQFVELEINGEYRGNYYLCEQIKIDDNRVKITALEDGAGFGDMSGGYLMEIDSYWDELNKFKSQYFDLRYMFKEPDEAPTKLSPIPEYNYGTAYSTMKKFINDFEKSVKTKSAVEAGQYANYLDVDSAIMFMLLNELVGNGDFFQESNDEVFGPHSTYLYRDKGVNKKLFMGPVWDFDYLTFTPSSSWKGFYSNQYYYYYLCHNQSFVNKIQSLWSKYYEEFAKLPDYITSMKTKLTDSQKFDEAKWPTWNQGNRRDNGDYNLSFEGAIDRMKTSYNNRLEWLNGKIEGLVVTEPRTERQHVKQNGMWVWLEAEWEFL